MRPAQLAVESRHQLTEMRWQQVADRMCCDDRAYMESHVGGQEWPYFAIQTQGQALSVLLERSDGPYPFGLVGILGGARLAGEDLTLPPGWHRFAQFPTGFFVSTTRGEWGGDLEFYSNEGKRQRVFKEKNAVLGVLARGVAAAVALERHTRNSSDVVCLKQEVDGAWHEVSRFGIAGGLLLGVDDRSDALVVSFIGEVYSLDCSVGLSLLAELPLPDVMRRFRSRENLDECHNLPLVPESVRRFADGRIAVATRNSVTVLRPGSPGSQGTPMTETWYGRTAWCESSVGRTRLYRED